MSFFEFPNTRTYDSDLGWLIKKVNSYDEVIAALNTWIEENTPKIDDLMALYEMMLSGDLPEGIQNGINKWMSLHAYDLIGEMVKHVYFGLNNAGYFIVSIPEQWKELVFNTTGYDINVAIQPDFGHLTISY